MTKLLSQLCRGAVKLLSEDDAPGPIPAQMESAMDSTVDPCEDFYTYACGRWDAKAEIPDDHTSWLKAWDVPEEDVQKQMQELMETNKGVVGTYFQVAFCLSRIGSRF